MRKSAKLVAGMIATLSLAGCSASGFGSYSSFAKDYNDNSTTVNLPTNVKKLSVQGKNGANILVSVKNGKLKRVRVLNTRPSDSSATVEMDEINSALAALISNKNAAFKTGKKIARLIDNEQNKTFTSSGIKSSVKSIEDGQFWAVDMTSAK